MENNGAETVYTDNAGECAEVKELLYLTAEVQNAALPDAVIEKHKVQAEYDWMVRNFTVQEEVPELPVSVRRLLLQGEAGLPAHTHGQAERHRKPGVFHMFRENKRDGGSMT